MSDMSTTLRATAIGVEQSTPQQNGEKSPAIIPTEVDTTNTTVAQNQPVINAIEGRAVQSPAGSVNRNDDSKSVPLRVLAIEDLTFEGTVRIEKLSVPTAIRSATLFSCAAALPCETKRLKACYFHA